MPTERGYSSGVERDERDKQVHRELESLNFEIDSVASNTSELVEIIQPILTPVPPTDDPESNVAERETLCPLADRINNLRIALKEANVSLSDIVSRLEI